MFVILIELKYILLNAGFILVREVVDPEINPRWTHTQYTHIHSIQTVSGAQSSDSQTSRLMEHRIAFVHFYFHGENKHLNFVRRSALSDIENSNGFNISKKNATASQLQCVSI